jgi:hypothetical protein
MKHLDSVEEKSCGHDDNIAPHLEKKKLDFITKQIMDMAIHLPSPLLNGYL